MGNLETRIMFLIVLLGALWLMLSETGRSYIANFAAVISGNNVILENKGVSKGKISVPRKTGANHTPAKSKGYKGLLPVHKFLGGLYPAP